MTVTEAGLLEFLGREVGERAASPDPLPLLANDCARAWTRCWDWLR